MKIAEDAYGLLLRLAADKLGGHPRRAFIAEVTFRLCEGNARRAEDRFGWGRETIRKGMRELQEGRVIENLKSRGRKRAEELNPRLAEDIRKLVEPRTYTDPELKTSRRYTNMAAGEVRRGLIDRKGWREQDVPAERTMRSILNRMNYRLKRIQKGRPLKKTKHTDAVFENVDAVKAASRDDPGTLEISADTKAKVALGDYSRGGENTDRLRRKSGPGVGS